MKVLELVKNYLSARKSELVAKKAERCLGYFHLSAYIKTISVSQLPTAGLNRLKITLTVGEIGWSSQLIRFIDIQHNDSSLIEARLTGTQVSIKVTAKDSCKRAGEIGDRLTAASRVKAFRQKSR
jgi:hypothetical protein